MRLHAIGTRERQPEFSQPVRRSSAPRDAINAVRYFNAYWNGLQAARGTIPPRQDLDPVEIGTGPLPWVVISTVCRDDGGIYLHCRLCGTGMAEFLGLDLTGRSTRQTVPAANYENVMRPYLTAIEEAAPGFWETRVLHDQAGWRPAVRGVWPLSDDGTTVTHLVNLTVPRTVDPR